MEVNISIALVTDFNKTRMIKLIITNTNLQWCHVFVLYNDQSINLGADAFYIIKERFLKNLIYPILNKENVDIKEKEWVLSLSERHHVILFDKSNNTTNLYVIDQIGDILDKFILK